jgi:SPP1 gp7 family putative phage head morphogenesis protein
MFRIKPKLKGKRGRKAIRIPRFHTISKFIRWYRELLYRIVQLGEDAYKATISRGLEQLSSESRLEGFVQRDAWDESLDHLIKQFELALNNRINKDKVLYTLQIIAKGINEQNRNDISGAIHKLFNVNISQYEPWLKSMISSFTTNNLKLITALRQNVSDEVHRIISSGIKAGKRVEKIRKELEGSTLQSGVFSKVKIRASLIARDQVGKLNGDITRARQREIGVEFYVWRGTRDERIREAHDALDGKYCSWEDGTVYADTLQDAKEGNWKQRSSIAAFEGAPGEDFQCRCYAEPIFDTIIEEEE